MSANIVSVDNPIKIISTSKINKVFSTNAVNGVEVSKEKIIKSNNKLREVVEAGYLLYSINLSTVPDIIADAITKAMSDTKDAVLSDSLLATLRTDLENLDDGVYKKTYIDNTITYLEDLLTSKVDAETVASIADSKIAIASEGFAAASTVNLLTSRVGNSESAIISLAETVNTKDTARANQITELEASIDESFSGYSEAIDLYVDAEGNIISRKIEEIAAQNYSAKVSINELNEITLDDEGTYTAYVAKTITDSNGKTVGLQFADSNELTSFLINADTFKISNSTNDYTPFSIVDNNLLFNGKVTFSNITGGDSILTVDNVQDAINNNVTSIDGGKIVTNAAFVNNLNATGGIIADYVNANELNGLTINGGIINGARINGAVIKASYLDLNGELEVLTNYIITVAMYNANPSLYTDAVYISSDNQYRIPSLSTIKNKGSSTITEALHNTVRYMYISENIKSYNNANSGHNTKCVRIDPSFNILTSKLYYYSDKRFDIHSRNTGAATIYLCSFYVNSQEVARCYHSVVRGGTYFIRIFDVRSNATYSSSSFSVSSSASFNAVILNGLDVSVSVSASTYDTSDTDLPYGFTYSVFLNPCVVSNISNFTSGNLLYMSYYSYYYYGYAFGATQAFRTYAYNPASNITINNMI